MKFNDAILRQQLEVVCTKLRFVLVAGTDYFAISVRLCIISQRIEAVFAEDALAVHLKLEVLGRHVRDTPITLQKRDVLPSDFRARFCSHIRKD